MPIIRRNEPEEKLVTREDPFRWMRDMMTSMPTWFAPNEPTFVPAFEVKETKDSFQFKADLPGIKDKDIEIKLTGNRLVISGKREDEVEDKGDTYYTYERSFGSFQRAFMLPDGLDADHVFAELKDGVLTVAIPKKAAVLTKNIAIKTAESAKH